MIQTRPADMHSSSGNGRSSILSVAVLGVALLFGLSALPARAQDSGDPSRQQKLMHYSLYYENFKNDNFESARSDLMWILENAPALPENDDRNYERAVQLYKGLAEQASSEKKRVAYLDTAATYLSSATEKMKERGIQYDEYTWEIRKGRFVENYEDVLSNIEGLKSPIVHYRNAFELAPQEVNAYYIRRVMQYYLEQDDLQQALDFAETVEQKRGDDEEVAEMVASVRNRIFSMNPQAKIAHLEKQVEQYPDSTQLLSELYNAYSQQGNVSKASELAPRLMSREPSAETVRKIAQMRLENGRPKEALKAYDRAVEQGAELQAEDHFNRGSAYQEMGQLQQARAAYRKALDLKSDFGRAYLAIGDLYALAVNQCSSEMERNDRAVFWAAVDKYQQAKQADPSIASTANTKIQRYREVFPTSEDIFYRDDWENGGSFTIDYGCYSWIGETTTVRQAPS